MAGAEGGKLLFLGVRKGLGCWCETAGLGLTLCPEALPDERKCQRNPCLQTHFRVGEGPCVSFYSGKDATSLAGCRARRRGRRGREPIHVLTNAVSQRGAKGG